MKLETQQIIGAVQELSILKFFPASPGEQQAVMDLLDKIVDSPQRLRWLVDTMVNYIGEWPGPAQMRALYATRFRPADGIEGTHCAIAGFTPMDSERAALEARDNLKIEGARTARGLLQAATAQRKIQ